MVVLVQLCSNTLEHKSTRALEKKVKKIKKIKKIKNKKNPAKSEKSAVLQYLHL